MRNNICISIVIMALVTYLIRVIPLTVFRKEIKNKFIKSFLYYVPYVTLSVMTFPAILYAGGSLYSGLLAFIVALAAAHITASLPLVAAISCLSVFISYLF